MGMREWVALVYLVLCLVVFRQVIRHIKPRDRAAKPGARAKGKRITKPYLGPFWRDKPADWRDAIYNPREFRDGKSRPDTRR